ncbi:NusA-like transcription termination signal-binding factor [Candidatus Woesearchaeota archaeon]|nr:MAG: NusA-like transcription termination signal-binding factor [Candidatus Woesearchaeota archaeon]
MSLFERMTKAKLKDCFVDSNGVLVFVVQNGDIGKALGKHGKMAMKITQKLNRKIKIVEYSQDLIKFIKNLILPYTVNAIEQEDDVVILKSDDTRVKGLLIGKNGKNLRNYESIVQRYFPIKEIKVE